MGKIGIGKIVMVALVALTATFLPSSASLAGGQSYCSKNPGAPQCKKSIDCTKTPNAPECAIVQTPKCNIDLDKSPPDIERFNEMVTPTCGPVGTLVKVSQTTFDLANYKTVILELHDPANPTAPERYLGMATVEVDPDGAGHYSAVVPVYPNQLPTSYPHAYEITATADDPTSDPRKGGLAVGTDVFALTEH